METSIRAAARPTTTLPFDWYVDPDVLRRERQRVFRRCWQYGGHTGQLPAPGSLAPARAGHLPVLLVRDSDGTLRAFLNVCRHRGSVLVEQEVRRSTIQCPYHAWTYELDGSLRTAPRSEHEGDFAASELALVPFAVDRWGPFIFVNPDAGAAPLSETLGELPELVASAGVDVDALRFRVRQESSYAANWKICCENFLECYHCPVAHPGLARTLDVSPEAYRLVESRTFSSQYAPVRQRWAGDFDPTGRVARGQFHFLFPNVTVNIAPGRPNLSIGPVLPDGPERTTRFLDYFFAPDAEETWIREMLAWDTQVGSEDTALVERVQRGVRSGALERGVLLAGSERLIAHFARWMEAALEG